MKKSNILGLDAGNVRVGIALVRAEVSIPVPVTTLLRGGTTFWEQLGEIINNNDVSQLVIGLPRSLDGHETEQTVSTRNFGNELASRTGLPISWQDEALTSVQAESALKKTGKPYVKGDIDSLAACYILSDYMEANKIAV